jgi:DNA repair photolyase
LAFPGIYLILKITTEGQTIIKIIGLLAKARFLFPSFRKDSRVYFRIKMKLLLKARKSSVLSPSSLKCLNDIFTLNPTAGCVHLCSYCYARGYSNYPGDGTVILYSNIARKLENELNHKRKLPGFVYFSPSCDAFQPVKQVLDTTFNLMSTLLERGIGISFLTKGHIPDKFIILFKRHSNLVHAHIGITTLNSRIQGVIEPHAAPPKIRIKNINSLTNIGILPEIKLDPLLPGLTDSTSNLEPLFKTLNRAGIKSAGINYLFLRAIIYKNIRKALANTKALSRISRAFYNSVDLGLLAGRSRVKALNPHFRMKQYERISLLAEKYGIKTHLCGCKNPDVTKELACRDIWHKYFSKRTTQFQLFDSTTVSEIQ